MPRPCWGHAVDMLGPRQGHAGATLGEQGQGLTHDSASVWIWTGQDARPRGDRQYGTYRSSEGRVKGGYASLSVI